MRIFRRCLQERAEQLLQDGWELAGTAWSESVGREFLMATDGDASIDVSDLGPVSRKIVRMVVERLRIGKERYGDWTENSRDMMKEALDEALDLAVYLARTRVE